MDLIPTEIWDLIFKHLKINDTKVFALRRTCKKFKFLISNYVYNTRFQKLKKNLIDKALSVDYLPRSNRLELVIKGTEKDCLIGAIRRITVPNSLTGNCSNFWIHRPTNESLEVSESQLRECLSESREAFNKEFVHEDNWFDGYLFNWEKLHSSLSDVLIECRPITKIGIKGIVYRNGSRIQATYDFMKDAKDYMGLFNHGTYYLCCAIEEGSIKP